MHKTARITDPSRFSDIMYNSIKGSEAEVLKKFGVMANDDRKIYLNFITKVRNFSFVNSFNLFTVCAQVKFISV